MTQRDPVEWLDMMLKYSQLTDCKPMLAAVHAELLSLRERVRELEAWRQLLEARSQHRETAQ